MPLLRQLGALCLGVGLTVASLGTTPSVGTTSLPPTSPAGVTADPGSDPGSDHRP